MYQVNDMYLGVFMLDSLYIQNNLHSHPIHLIITCNQLENLIQYKYLEIEMKRMQNTNNFITTTN